MKTLLSFLFLFIGLVPLRAQYSFAGTVIDDKKETLPGAQVMLYKGDSLCGASLTDQSGKFLIKNLQEGEYGLQILFTGYTPLQEQRTIKRNQNFEFMLMPEMSVDLGNVEVLGHRSDHVKRTATGQIFYLSEQAKNSGDPFRALGEIPKLVTNDALKQVTMEDGSSPLILINGIAVNTGISPIDPKDIESVEVMDVVNARYLRTGAKHILNIRLKEKKAPYSYFETMTRHDLPAHLGMGAVYFEIGNSKYSLYGRGAAEYTYHDDIDLSEWQQGSHYFKQSTGKSRADSHVLLGELLFKWMAGSKDYVAFHVYLSNNNKKTMASGLGMYKEREEPQDFAYSSSNRDKSNLLTTSLYHKHNFTDEKVLETTFAFNKNWNTNEGERGEDYSDWLYRNIYEYDNQRASASLNMDYSWNINETNSLNIGSETRYVNDRIHQITSQYPVFHHREWSEYMYASFSGQVKDLRYMLSAGGEGFWLKAGEESAHYVKPRVALSGTYSLTDNHSFMLDYTLTNRPPEVGQLNPYNTSTDSLVRTIGNPDLKPFQNHKIALSYTFNKSGLYITPAFDYNFYTDVIEPYGYSENDIYISTYRNQGKYKELSAGGTVSYRLGKWGRVYVYGSHNVAYFEAQQARKYLTAGAGVSATYKKLSFYGYVFYQDYAYTAVSKEHYHSPSYSSVQLNYNFTPNFYIALALQYLHSPQHTDIMTYSDNYRSFSSRKLQDASLRPWILIRYTFRKNAKQKIKLDNVVRSRESGIELTK